MTGRLGAAVKAFILNAQGFKAVKPSNIREAMRPKSLPDPTYPADLLDHQEAAD